MHPSESARLDLAGKFVIDQQECASVNSFIVPKVTSRPEQGGNEFPVVSLADFLLTSLLEGSGKLLRASDDGGETVAWTVDEKTIAHTPRELFRTVLARFGHHYMNDQLYSGFALVELRQGHFKSVCHFYLGNCGDTGFWIEVYARKVQSTET
jgi:hypothetical protein